MLSEIHVYLAILVTLAYLFLGKESLGHNKSGMISSFFCWVSNKVILAPILGLVVLWVLPFGMALLGIDASYQLTIESATGVIVNDIDLVVLILALAYLSISLDESGFFEYASVKIIKVSHGSGSKLLVNLFLLTSVLTYFTSNDIVIIAMTPIILYVSKHTGGHNAIPLLISLFVGANTLSMGLYIGSPTNIVIGDAVGLSFIEYLKLMLVPSIVAAITSLGMLYLIFVRFPISGNKIFHSYSLPLMDKHDKPTEIMLLKSFVFILCIIILSIVPSEVLQIWEVCLSFAFIMFCIDMIYLWYIKKSLVLFVNKVTSKLPWEIAPFVISFFVLVNAMEGTTLSNETMSFVMYLFDQGLVYGVLGAGYLSAISVNLMNDIPSTMFWANLLGNIQPQLTEQNFKVLIVAILIGVNPGCYLTIIGALAGLMWIKIIGTSNVSKELITPTAWDLTKYGSIILIPVLSITLLAVVVQAKYFY